MKAIIRASVLSGLFLLSLLFFICSQLNAQTVISIDSFTDSAVVMKFANCDLINNPQKLILIIDNAAMENQLSEDEILAWLDSRHSNSTRSVVFEPNAKKRIIIDEQNENLMNYLVERTLAENIEAEDEIETEEWMFSSENWLSEIVE
jgi:hypothetical protein